MNIFLKAKRVIKIFIKIESLWRSVLNMKRKKRRQENNSTETKENGEFQEKSKNAKCFNSDISFFSH